MFFAYGFAAAKDLGRKMVTTFKLCSEQCSSQPHYDYGMRAVKTVITAAGNLKAAAPDEDEMALLLRALQDVNVPKFLAHDLPLFDGILSDLFPGIERPAFDYGPLLNALKVATETFNLQPVPIFLRKNIELYEMICVRHGLMVVGPTGGGKSANIKVLKEALTFLKKHGIEGIRYEAAYTHHLNPKSITMGQLYGMFDPNTLEWQDGILRTSCGSASRRATCPTCSGALRRPGRRHLDREHEHGARRQQEALPHVGRDHVALRVDDDDVRARGPRGRVARDRLALRHDLHGAQVARL